MDVPRRNDELRKALADITSTTDIPVTDHPKHINELSKQNSHSIKVLDSKEPIADYQCIEFAFNLVNDPDCDMVKHDTHLSLNIFPSPEFVQYLLSRGLLSPIALNGTLEEGCIIYSNNNEVKHAGKLISPERVISKWGRGYLYEHNIDEVPESYGYTFACYEQISKDQAKDYFHDFAEHKGFKFAE